MTDDLLEAFDGPYDDRHATGQPFAIPAVPPDQLTVARKRFEAALFAYDEAVRIDEECDGSGIVPDEIKCELGRAAHELASIENTRMFELKYPPQK